MILLLAIAIMLLAALINNYHFLVFSNVICFGISIFLIFRLIANGQATRFFLFSSLSCGAWITGGFLQSAWNLLGQSRLDFIGLFRASSIVIDVSLYALASAYLFLFIFFTALLSRLSFVRHAERQFDRHVIVRLRSVSLKLWTTLLFLSSLSLFMIAFLGLFSIRGLGEEYLSDQGILPWWYVLIVFFIGLLPLLVSQVAAKLRSFFSFPCFTLFFGFIVGLYYNSLTGRFALLSFILLIPFCWVAIQSPLLRFNSRQLTFLSIIAVTILALLPFVNFFFAFINVIRSNRGLYTDPFVLIASFVDFVASPSTVTTAIERSAENLTARPLILWPLAATIGMTINGGHSGYLYFDELINSALNSLPRFIYPFKSTLLLQEQLLYHHFPFASVDTADSPYLYSFASFGIVGSFIYPLVICLIYSLFLNFIVFTSMLSFWLPTSIASSSALISLSIVSYGELPTTGLLRRFIVPGSVAFATLLFAFLKSSSSRLSRARPVDSF
ncbi:hypothetical protein KQ313_14045 [Synechococcus sp. CS-1325]|nr:hypothetical protein [Synechococcus sp. CS-1325]